MKNLKVLPLEIILSVMLVMGIVVSSGAARLTGTMIDSEGNPISGVKISVRFNNDSTAKVYYTNLEGKYDLIVDNGFNEIKFSKDGYNNLEFNMEITRDFIGDRLLLTVNEEEQARLLAEVQVTAKMLRNFTNRTEMYLTKENREFGINALDAISSLPLFQSGFNTKDLTNLTGASVSILINGRRASPEEIRNLSGENIRKVVYYENPPAQYAAFFSGPIINVFLTPVKRLEVTGNVNADANNSWGGSGDIGANLLSPEHYLNGSFSIGGSHIDHAQSGESFSYPGLTDSFITNDASSRGLQTYSFLSYQWDRGQHMLFAKASYYSSTSKNTYPMEIFETGEEKAVYGTRLANSHDTRDMMSLNLYYTYQFKSGQELSFDLVNGYNKATNMGYKIQTMEEGSAYGDFHNDASTRNSVYNLVASAMFSSPLGGGDFSFSLTGNYRRLTQNYTDNFFPDLPSHIRNDASSMDATADYQRSFGKFGVNASLSLFWTSLSLSEGGRQNQVKGYPRLTFSYNVSDNVFLSLMGWVQSSQTSIGRMNLNRYVIDTRYFGENLPYEKAVFKYCGLFSPRFTFPACKLTVMPSVMYRYARHPYISYIFAEDDNFIRRSLTIPFEHDLSYNLGVRWNPIAGLDINPYFSGQHTAYNTPVEPVRFNWLKFRLNLSYSTGRFQFTAGCSSPTKSMDGVQTSHSGWSAEASGLWKKGGWYVGASYSFREDTGWTVEEIPGFSHYQTWNQPRQGWIISAMVGYSFKAGKDVRNRRKNKRISQGASETGF